ncbi:MAG TPA: type 1 glutamine amidotransferase domain-containing protein [Methanocella sp.]|nr:type 1 glutamine amidotransferase domain-containing protein [Methanocella sp.]
MNELKGKRIVIVADNGFEDTELMYPLYRLRHEACADVTLAGINSGDDLKGKHGIPVTTDVAISDLNPDDFDALIIPGGGSPDHLRIYPEVIQFVQDFDRSGKPVAAICHGIQILITARLLKGREATGWKSLVVDIEDAGAKYIDRPLVTSGQYIFSRQPSDLGHFCEAIISSMSSGESTSAAEMARV